VGLAAGVFDGLSLVQNQVVVLVLGKALEVPDHQRIADDHDVGTSQARKLLAAAGAGNYYRFERGSEAADFTAPVLDQALRRHHQARQVRAPRFVFED
jgi:hypothetical protein